MEYCFIGILAEKDAKGSRLFLTVPETDPYLPEIKQKPPCLKTIASFHLYHEDKEKTLDQCWDFAFRQIDVKEEKTKETYPKSKWKTLVKNARKKSALQ